MKTAKVYLDQDDAFARFVLYSVGAHIILFAALLIKAAFAPSEPIEIRNAIRVDVVDMPDKIVAPPAPVAKPEPTVELPKPAEVKPEMPKPIAEPKKPVEDLQKKAIDKLKALDALQKMQQEATAKAEADKAAEKAKAKPLTYKGNIVNQGDSLTGLEKIQFDRYFITLKDHVNQNWSIPQWLEQANLRAQALVILDSQGFVVKREITQSSGNDIFDGHVLNAIDKSSPFPEPPDKLKGVLNMRGILLKFPD